MADFASVFCCFRLNGSSVMTMEWPAALAAPCFSSAATFRISALFVYDSTDYDIHMYDLRTPLH